MYCENCGTSVEAGSKFCSACGNNIDADAQAPRTSQSNFASEGRRSSSQNLQTIILISVSALLLVTIAAWLIIPSAFHIGDHLSPSDSNIKSLLEAEWNKYSFTVPLGN